MIIDNDKLLDVPKGTVYKTKIIKKTFDTKITEFSSDGSYDYLPGPEIRVEYPNDVGMKFWIDDDMTITWTCEEAQLVSNVNIFYGKGNEIFKIASPLNNYTSSFQWTINTNDITGSDFYIYINGEFDNELFEDSSDNYFIIDKRWIDILPFNTNKVTANVGNVFPIKWTSNGISKNVQIDMLNYIDNSIITTLKNPYYIENENEYNWVVDNISKDIDKVKIKITDLEHNKVYDISDEIDLIVPYLKLISLGTNSFNPYIRIRSLSTSTYNPSLKIVNFIIV